MKNLILLAILSVSLFSCDEMIEGEGDVTTRDYSLKDFHGVILDMPGELIITQGEQFIEVTTNENIYEWLNLYVSKGILHIELQDNKDVWAFDKMRFDVSIPNPTYIKLEGSGDVVVHDSIVVTDNMELVLEGSGDIILSKLVAKHVDLLLEGSGNMRCDEVRSESIYSEIEGSGNITLAGEVVVSAIEVEGSGDIHSYELVSQDATVESDGSGDCHINVLKTLSVELEGSGSVYYKGNPSITINTEGSGSVNRVN